MQAKRAAMNKGNMIAWTERAKQYCQDLYARADEVANDNRQDEREKAQECKACFYMPRIGGCVMTTQPCMCCGKEVMFSSTATDRLCLDCAKKHSLCKRCGGDISMRSRRKEWPEKEAE
jgi:hypothetical protein